MGQASVTGGECPSIGGLGSKEDSWCSLSVCHVSGTALTTVYVLAPSSPFHNLGVGVIFILQERRKIG